MRVDALSSFHETGHKSLHDTYRRGRMYMRVVANIGGRGGSNLTQIQGSVPAQHNQ